MQINLNDPRLSPSERSWLKGLERKLAEPPRSLPADYKRKLDEMFSTCGEGEKDRWQSEK